MWKSIQFHRLVCLGFLNLLLLTIERPVFANPIDSSSMAALKTAPQGGSAATEHTMDELRKIIADGIAAGLPRILIPPGVYPGVPEPKKRVHLTISKASDLEIIADGVTMLCADLTRAITLDHCTRVMIRGLTVDYDPLPFTQGDIVTVNPAEGWLDVKIHDGYPLRAQSRIDVVDRATRFRKKNSPFMWESKAEIQSNGIVRLTNQAASHFAKVGDLASLGASLPGVIAHSIAIEDSDSVTFEHVTVFSSNCMGIVASGGEGGHHFNYCRVVPGPPPAGATEARILSTDADAILTGKMRKGVLTENCEIRDAGDDSWSVQSSDMVVLKREGQTFFISQRESSGGLQVGDRLQTALGAPVGTVIALETMRRKNVALNPEISTKLTTSGKLGFWHLTASEENGWVTKVALSGEVAWTEGTSIYDIDRQGNGFVFRNNKIHSSGRVLIKASGLVENNDIDGLHSIMVNPEVPDGAAVGITEVVIRNNRMNDAHPSNSLQNHPAGAISVTANETHHSFLPAGGLGHILIEGNMVQKGNGAAMVITSARNVEIRNNTIDQPQQVAPDGNGSSCGVDNHAVIWLAQCDSVVLQGNQILNPGPYISQPLVLGPGIKQVASDLAHLSAAAVTK